MNTDAETGVLRSASYIKHDEVNIIRMYAIQRQCEYL